MAEARQILRRRKAIRNIHKLCYTMQLIATARFKRAMDRAMQAAAYTERIAAMAADLGRAAAAIEHPLLQVREPQRCTALLVITANRGLCGGYNSNILRAATHHLERLAQQEVLLDVAGKRGIAYFRFRRIPMRATYTHFEDKVRFEEVRALADRYMDAYAAAEIDRVDVVYMKFISAGRQVPVVETLLPLTRPGDDGEQITAVQYEFYPNPEDLLAEILTMAFRTRLFKCFLDAASSEQIARMVAMKGATENAARMDKQLTLLYNRARQEKITKELAEIVGGAEALK